MMEIHREKFVSSKDFLKSARSIGIGVEEGVYEIIDNALDAEAQNIWISIDKKDNGNFEFIFVDDGLGIKKIHEDKDGIQHQGIPYVLTYGGRIPHPNQTKPIGKFGFGLSQTASCLSSRTEVYSKTADDENWRFAYYDFKELLDADCEIELEIERQPPLLTLPETGTIVIMREVDQADYAQVNPIVNMLVKNLGRVYRHYLNYDTTISISNGKTEKQVEVSDPLVTMENSLEFKNLGGESIDYGEFVITFDDKNPLGEIIDRRTGEPAECVISLRRLSIETVRNALGFPLTGTLSPNNVKINNKWGLNDRGQGFSVLRNGRELSHNNTLKLYSRHSDYNMFRGHIAFSDALDDLFEVKTNKCRFKINTDLANLILEECEEKIVSIGRDHRNESSRLNYEKRESDIPVAERIASQVNHMLSRPRISDKQREEGNEEVAKQVQTIIEKQLEINDKLIHSASQRLSVAKKTKSLSQIKSAETNLRVVTEKAEKEIATIRQRFDFDSNCRKFVDVVGTGGLFEIAARGDHAWITINSATEFYSRVYSLAEKDPDLVGLLDLLIFSIAWSEHTDDFEQKSNWEHIRREISAQAEIFVSSMSSLVNGGEA